MATWLVHLRVADVLLAGIRVPRTDFLVGNIAPDCGIPDGNGGFDPPSSATHWTTKGKSCCDYASFAEHILPLAQNENQRAFLLGYYSHLITDVLWSKLINQPCKLAFRELYENDRDEYYRLVKADWYDNDAAYLSAHPDLAVLAEFSAVKNYDSSIIPYYGKDNVQLQIENITQFYQTRRWDGREFIYITPEQINAFVPTAAELISEKLFTLI